MIRKTKGMVAIAEFIKSSDTPVSSADVLRYIENSAVSVNRATVFRILSRLVKNDDIYEVNLGDGKTRYEWNGDHHHHLVCNKCKSITPLHFCDAESIARNEARNLGFQIHSHSLEYFGLCKNCK